MWTGPAWKVMVMTAWRNLEFQNVTLSFNKIMIPSTSLGEPKGGLKSRGSIFWIGLHSLQILTTLNILGITSRDVSQLMRVLLQEFITDGKGEWSSGGKLMRNSVKN